MFKYVFYWAINLNEYLSRWRCSWVDQHLLILGKWKKLRTVGKILNQTFIFQCLYKKNLSKSQFAGFLNFLESFSTCSRQTFDKKYIKKLIFVNKKSLKNIQNFKDLILTLLSFDKFDLEKQQFLIKYTKTTKK